MLIRTERSTPWSLNGNSGGSYNAYGPMSGLGQHNVTVQAFDRRGARLGTSTVIYTVTVDSTPSNAPVNQAPVVAPVPMGPVQAPPSPPTKDLVAPVQAPVPVAPVKSPPIPPTNSLVPAAPAPLAPTPLVPVTVMGELRKWHKITTFFVGPITSETGTPNPFLDYRLDVTFVHSSSGKQYKVPGYFAADGNAAETSATSGNVWHCHFCPDDTGVWTFSASFVTGSNVAVAVSGGTPTSFHGQTGSLTVAASNKTGRDLRGKGQLQYVGQHHLKFSDGEWFLKAGVDRYATVFFAVLVMHDLSC
jgi:Domain of unknown function (DUF5060)